MQYANGWVFDTHLHQASQAMTIITEMPVLLECRSGEPVTITTCQESTIVSAPYPTNIYKCTLGTRVIIPSCQALIKPDMHALYINNEIMPTPKQIKIDKEKIWSSDSGRSASALFSGTLVAKKRKLTIDFPPLSYVDAQRLDKYVSGMNPFVEAEYFNELGQYQSGYFYFGNPSYTHIKVGSNGMVNNISITMIER